MAQSKAELLSLQQLRCFCAAFELGSFTAAAEALRVSQPAVAEQIRKLEQALGADLFVRAGRGVVATEAGRAFAEHATRSLRAVEDAADSVGELTELRTGTRRARRLRRPVGVAPRRRRSQAFLRRHPNVSVRLHRPQLVDDRGPHPPRRARGRPGLLPIDDDKLDVRPIVRDEVALRQRRSPQRTREPATIERLATTPLVFYDAESADDDPIRRQLAERAQALGVRLQPKVEVELKDIALRLVAGGIGDTYLPSAFTHAPYYPDGLTRPPSSRALYDTFAIVTRAGARLSPGVRELLADARDAHARGRRRVRPRPLKAWLQRAQQRVGEQRDVPLVERQRRADLQHVAGRRPVVPTSTPQRAHPSRTAAASGRSTPQARPTPRTSPGPTAVERARARPRRSAARAPAPARRRSRRARPTPRRR